MFSSQERLSKNSARDQTQTGTVHPRPDENIYSRNTDQISIKVYNTTSNNKRNHIRHSSITGSQLTFSPSSFIGSTTKSPESMRKQMYANTARDMQTRPYSKNRTKKYCDRATRLSPRSWIKNKNVNKEVLIFIF